MVDIMSPKTRSALMSRIGPKNTWPEREIARALRKAGRRPQRHVRGLPGRPDFVFARARVAVFVDGDFWHGWRFPAWEYKLSPFWTKKIGDNRARDRRNFRKLRRAGWVVLRIWEHEIERDLERCVDRILVAVNDEISRK